MSQDLQPLGRALILMGAVIALVGCVFAFSQKLPWLGRLPLDIRVERPGFSFYFPVGTCLLLSAAASLAMWVAGKFKP